MMTFIQKRGNDVDITDYKVFIGKPSKDQLVDHKGDKLKFHYLKPKTNDAGWKSATMRGDIIDGKLPVRINTLGSDQEVPKPMIDGIKTYFADEGTSCEVDNNYLLCDCDSEETYKGLPNLVFKLQGRWFN